MAVVALAPVVSPAAADGVERGDAGFPSLISRIARDAELPIPELTAEDIDALRAGQPVAMLAMESPAQEGSDVGGMGVVGLQIVDAPRLLVWLTTLGAASEPDARLTRAFLDMRSAGSYVRYQHVNLPWPIRDRHWVILCEKNTDVARASDGLIWQHRWALVENGQRDIRAAFEDGRIEGLSERVLERSIYLPANRGAWTLAELPEGRTLVIAWFDGRFGGRLPAALVRRFSLMHLRAGLGLISDLTSTVHEEYGEDPLRYDGFGKPILRDQVAAIADGDRLARLRQVD